MGLVNKEYKERQTTAKAQQMLYFRNREAFFDEQMDGTKYNRDTMLGNVGQRTSVLQDLVVSLVDQFLMIWGQVYERWIALSTG